MILKSTTSQRWDFRPLSPMTTINIGVAGGSLVPGMQDYCPDTDVYTPDYTLAPLVLQPTVAVFCEDTNEATSNANPRLHNIEWREVSKSGSKLIVTSTTPTSDQICGAGRDNDPYDATGCAEGLSTSGRLIVKRNFPPGENTTLVFTAKLTDTRSGETHDVRSTFSIKTIASWATPVLNVDAPSVTSYDPIRNQDEQIVKAYLMLGGKECPIANREFVWEVEDDNGGWRTYGTDILDYWMTISADTSVATIRRTLMGDGQKIRVRAKYDRDGNPTSAPNSDMLTKEFAIERVLRGLNLETAITNRIRPGMNGIGATAIVSDGQGRIPTSVVDDVFDIKWRTAPNSANLASPSYSNVVRGAEAVVPTNAMNANYGMLTQCEVDDRGPLRPIADGDEFILVDGDGKVILAK